MRRGALFMLAGLLTVSAAAAGEESANQYQGGLVAHYFQDSANWNGKWPDRLDKPPAEVRVADWTFGEYKYSRVEPVINNLFINKGWFSVRWKGYFNPAATGSDSPAGAVVAGTININPNNGADSEFVASIANGRSITRDDLSRQFQGYEGPASSVSVRPKGNGNQNTLNVNGLPYVIVNGKGYDIVSDKMQIRIYNDKVNNKGKSMGSWRVEINADNATVLCREKDPTATGARSAGDGMGTDPGVLCFFELWADDGCRLIIDDQVIIDDWVACWEKAPEALRTSRAIRLTDGPHKIVVEYFQGLSQVKDDSDPIKLYWTCPARRISRQIVQPSQLSHTPADMVSHERK